MRGRTVSTPGGVTWRVRRLWAPRLGGETLWERFRRKTRISRRVARDASDIPDPGCVVDALDDLLLVVAIIAIVLFVVFVGLPLLLAILDVILLLVLTVLGVAARVVFRRPWVVEARSSTAVPRAPRDGVARPSDAANIAVRRYTWRVVGWQASGETVDAVADALAHGLAMPPGYDETSLPASA